MRILHTSDWHLGQNFYSKSRAAEHEAFLNWLLDTARSHEVDAIIVAGDIFDTGSPPSYARELYNRFVVNLQQTGCHLVIVAGNHDSVATLNESRDILAFLNTTVVASAGHAPQILKKLDGTPGAVLCPVPFLRPRDIVQSQAGMSGGEKQRVSLIRNLQFLPRVLLLDEITSALDESNKQNVNEIIHGYATEKQVAVLWVTHDRNEISHADDVITLQPAGGNMQEVQHERA